MAGRAPPDIPFDYGGDAVYAASAAVKEGRCEGGQVAGAARVTGSTPATIPASMAAGIPLGPTPHSRKRVVRRSQPSQIRSVSESGT